MSKPKVIAFYLPQFHSIPENDKWWGEGFTEWTNTKKAIPLFKGHQQPKEPYNDNYYCLLDKETQEWQSKLAKDHGIYGFCYYHYWFGGKLLLEKPMEQMLQNKNIELPFCISWANEPWARTWDGKDKEILMPQIYGGEKEWKDHFEYLLQFFQDERYIKVNNKPMFLIYRTSNIPRCDDMIKYWNNMSKKCGFDGMYIVETVNSFQKKSELVNSDAVVEFEPMLTTRHYFPLHMQIYRLLKKKIGLLDKVRYDYIWKKVLSKDINYNKEKFNCGFISWDNTARKGKKGLVLTEYSHEKLKLYLKAHYRKAAEKNNDFYFINAWNEWAEGTYLEPDKLDEFTKINIVKEMINGE